MAILNRDALIQKREVKTKKVDLGNGDFVFVRQMNGKEKEHWERLITKEVKKGNEITYVSTPDGFRAKLCVCTVCDEKGELLLKLEDWKDINENWPGPMIEKIADAAGELNKVAEKDKETLEKN